MKKVLSLIVVFALCLSLCACLNRPALQPQKPSGGTANQEKPDPTTPPTQDTPVVPDNDPTQDTPATEDPTEDPTPPETQPPTCNHDWQDATCTEPKTCSVCNETEGNALGHTWTEPTCTEPKTCSVCNLTEETPGHSWVDATCTEPKTCSVCNETEGDPLGHTWVDATCSTPKTCSICSETEGGPSDHEWRDATCTEPKTCNLCNLTEGDALGHSWVDATCAQAKHCSVCNLEEGSTTAHTWVDATCAAPKHCAVCGLFEGDTLPHTGGTPNCAYGAICEVCGQEYGDRTNDHNWVDATCTNPKHCTVCYLTEGNLLEHSYESGRCTMCGQSDPNAPTFNTGGQLPMKKKGYTISSISTSVSGSTLYLTLHGTRTASHSSPVAVLIDVFTYGYKSQTGNAREYLPDVAVGSSFSFTIVISDAIVPDCNRYNLWIA